MIDSIKKADALLTDHFTYTPLSLIDDIINAVNTIIYQGLDALEDGLSSVSPSQLGFDASVGPDAAKDEIENGVHKLETLLENTVDKSFDKFEIWTLRNILTVPEDLTRWIKLSHYEGLEVPIPTTAATPDSILQMRRRLNSASQLNKALRNRQQEDQQVVARLQNLSHISPSNPSLSFLHPRTELVSGSESEDKIANTTFGSRDLEMRVNAALLHLPSLRNLVEQLRPRVAILQAQNGRTQVGSRAATREERRIYVESTVRKIMEREGLTADEEESAARLESLDRELALEGDRKAGEARPYVALNKSLDEVEALERLAGQLAHADVVMKE